MNFALFCRNFEDTNNIYKIYLYMVNLKPTSFGHIEALRFPENNSNYLFEKVFFYFGNCLSDCRGKGCLPDRSSFDSVKFGYYVSIFYGWRTIDSFKR